jgi:hypothetical protein
MPAPVASQAQPARGGGTAASRWARPPHGIALPLRGKAGQVASSLGCTKRDAPAAFEARGSANNAAQAAPWELVQGLAQYLFPPIPCGIGTWI